MDRLNQAVVDVVMLISTSRALLSAPGGDEDAMDMRQRDRLRQEIKRATLAYLETLARAKRGIVDDNLVTKCRHAAESQMPLAIRRQSALEHMMSSQAGAMDGIAAARHDLWRLSHVAIYLRIGVAALRKSDVLAEAKSTGLSIAGLRRRMRKALITYARITLRSDEGGGPPLVKARRAALAEIGRRGAADVERLADIEAGGDPALTFIRRGVARPLLDLVDDWHAQPKHP